MKTQNLETKKGDFLARKKAWKPEMASLYAFSKADYYCSFFNESTIFQNFGVREWVLSETKQETFWLERKWSILVH